MDDQRDIDIIKQPIVIDNGSGQMKAGISGESEPSLVFNSYVGRPVYEKVMITQNEQETFIGEAADKYKGILKLNYPIEHGVVTNWDDMEALWRHVFEELKV
jgi:centractin